MASRTHLRGYAWLTYVPATLFDKIGGAEAMRTGGAFHAVRELPGGLIALQATPEPKSYGPTEVRRVHEALADLLTPGTPSPAVPSSRDAYNPAAPW